MSRGEKLRYILVSRKTRLEELVERFNTWPQARFYLEHNQVDAEDYLREHDLYTRRLVEAELILRKRGLFQKLERSFLPNFMFGPQDIVVVVGQDGLVANTLKYLDGQPVIGINPDPGRWDGKLLAFDMSGLEAAVCLTEAGRAAARQVTFAEAVTNDGQRILAVNDLFIGPRSHTSARYRLTLGEQAEDQSSSGIIVSTGLGSTGWLQSILAGALGVTGGKKHEMQGGFGWDEERLQYIVREPFPTHTTGASLVFGAITRQNEFMLESFMPDNGVIFSDGMEQDYIPFNSGCVATVSIAATKGLLVVR